MVARATLGEERAVMGTAPGLGRKAPVRGELSTVMHRIWLSPGALSMDMLRQRGWNGGCGGC